MSRASVTNPAQRIELTERQEAVIRLIANGLTNAEIAARIGVTLDGVKWHVREILGKFQVESREEAVERWREQRSTANRVRMWGAGVLASTAVRWAGGLAVAGGVGVVGTAVMVNSLRAEKDEDPVLPAVVAVATPDLATKDGLTLTIEKVEADDTLTSITFTLEGRPELGRLSGLPQGIFADRATGRLTDQDGVRYRMRSAGADITTSPGYRRWTYTFDPTPAGTRTLTLEMAGAPFVAPVAETQIGQRPPDPSAVIDGPWLATVVEVPRTATERIDLPGQEFPFGPGTILLERAVQTATETVIYGRMLGWTQEYDGHLMARWELRAADGSLLTQSGARWDNDGKLELRVERISGSVNLTVTGSARETATDATVTRYVLDGASDQTEEELRENARVAEATTVRLAALFAEQLPPTWTFTLP